MHRLRKVLEGVKSKDANIPKSYMKIFASIETSEDLESALNPTPKAIKVMKAWLMALPLQQLMTLFRALEELMWEREALKALNKEGESNGSKVKH